MNVYTQDKEKEEVEGLHNNNNNNNNVAGNDTGNSHSEPIDEARMS